MSDSSSDKVPTITEKVPAPTVSDAPEPTTRLRKILEDQGVRVDPAKAQVVLQRVETEIIKAHSGPLPAVEDFEGYEKVCPGAARDILEMAKMQQAHVHHIEKYAASSEFWLPILALGTIVLIVSGMFGCGVYLAMNGHENLAAGVISGTGLATVIGAILQRKKSEASVDQKAPAQPPARSRDLTRQERRARDAIRRAARDR